MEASLEEIETFLSTPKTLVIVGASTNVSKAGNYVPEFLKNRGFTIIPVNPFAENILGINTLKDLSELKESVDGIIIYRRPELVDEVITNAVDMKIPWIWLPTGVTSPNGPKIAKDLMYVENRCPLALIKSWINQGKWTN